METAKAIQKINKYKLPNVNTTCPICGNKQLLEFSSINKKSCTDCNIDIDYYSFRDTQ